MAKIIEIKNVTLENGPKRIFDNLNLDIEEGSFTTLMGASGSGKTTLSYLLLGLLPIDGEVRVLNQSLNDNYDVIKNNISVVFENSSSQFITATVEEELMISLEHLNYSAQEIQKKVKALSKKMEIMHLLNRHPQSLSSGEKQLIALATAIINRPKILILDNALCMVDNYTKTKIFKILKIFQKEGTTILHITHNPEDILMGDYVIIINNGQVILNDKVRSSLNHEKKFTQAHLKMPFMADLCVKLKYYNIISKIELDRVRLVKVIWK